VPRAMDITTPLGPDVLLFHTMHAREELSRVGECRLDLLSLKNDIKLDDILGKSVTIKLALQDESMRYFNGYVTRFSAGGSYGRYRRYYATVHPWLWFLSRTADCRIFQDKTVPEIVNIVLGEHPTNSFKESLTGSYAKWNYCVQYRETDLNFVCRLLEQEGIYFYFTHDDGKHTMVMTDSYSGHAAFQEEAVPFIAPEDLARRDIEHIDAWTLTREVQPTVYVHDDYDFERPSVELRAQKSVRRSYANNAAEIYDYPGEYTVKGDGDQLAAARIDEFAAQFETVQGAANVKMMSVGSLFTLEKCPREDQNIEHLVVAASYDLEYGDYEAMPDRRGADYRCGFIAMASKQQFRPKRVTPKPFVQGPQTAVVVGPGGEEIYTDKYGRVKVMFHWDRLGKQDENSSCWVRVSQPWAGKAWGGVAIPRMGQEVVVDFLEGDPDQPIITGRVYNAEQMPPYALPANKTQTGIKSRSSLSGTPDNFNEIRFEDKKGSEQLFIHAEKNQDIEVENDETHWVGHDRTKTIDNDEITYVKHDRTETVDNNESITIHGQRQERVDKDEGIGIGGDRKESVGGNEGITISGNRSESVGGAETVDVAKSRGHSIGQNDSLDVAKNRSQTIGENSTTSVGKNATLSITESWTVSVGKDHKEQTTKNYSLTAKQIYIEGQDQIEIKSGSASIMLKKNGDIEIKGNKISIKGSGDVVIKGSKIGEN
jgi:type VI secretion system secreted protein VgrG